jgi:hypothetical protein
LPRLVGRIVLWVIMIPVVALAAIYVTLLFTPIPLPFLTVEARNAVMRALPDSSRLELGDMALALEGGTWPVLQFSPVVLTDVKTGANVRMDALEVGFSPVRAIVGQPGVNVTMVGPHIQVNQDLFGPRLASFQIVPDPDGGRPTVRVLEGQDAFPPVGISAEGLDIRGTVPTGAASSKMRSDNDWLINNLEAAQKSISDIVAQAQLGRFSRLVIRDGIFDMNDALYGLFRTFDGIQLDITPTPDGRGASGSFSANFGGHTMHGIVERSVDADGSLRLQTDFTNMDFASFMPFINDRDAIIGVEGAGALSMDIHYSAEGKVLDGTFRIDMTGTDLRVEDDHFPIATSIIAVRWTPETATFTMDEADVSVGKSSGKVEGTFVLGLDPLYGPTIGMSVKARDVVLEPYDMEAPKAPFDSMQFDGWSAPLYGALGIDQFTASKGEARIAAKGRADLVQKGLGFTLLVGGVGNTPDDLKRLWPYFITRDSRDWFVKNISAGTIERSSMKYAFPIGSLPAPGEIKPLPPNSVSIDMVATGVRMQLLNGMDPINIDGQTKLWVKDAKVTIAADGARVETKAGDVGFANAAMVMGSEKQGERVIELSGDISGSIPAVLALTKKQQPDMIAKTKVPLDFDALDGNVKLTLVSTSRVDNAGETLSTDYAINGTVDNFGSKVPIETHTITGGQLAFTASQQSYRIAGQAKVDGLDADLIVEGQQGDTAPKILISSTLDINDLKSVGFDMGEFLSGNVKFVGRPMPDGTIQLAVDIADAALDIKDLGVSKKAGVPGLLEAQVKQTGTLTELTRVNLSFGDVTLRGSLDYDLEDGLVAADFTTFALSPGDDAQLALTPIADGYQMKLTGKQLDLKPMLKRFFGLGEGTGGPQATVFTKTLVMDAHLERALGFYKTTAFNLDLGLTLKGTDLQKVTLQAQLGNGKSVSVTTNPGPQGKVLSVAFNDLGTLLRLLNVYPNVEGGDGVLVLQTVDAQKYDVGELLLHNFAIVDEAKLTDIVGGHADGSRALSGSSSMKFTSGKVDFIRRKDRVEVTDGVVNSASVGGTVRGFIYTDAHRYDLTGTYIPFFGLNNMWQKLPILGPLLGGREGEGLFGVTFAVRGPLDKPQFQINPLSALAPGLFRGLFEFRAKEQPRVE